jgi:hypothetical protein
MHNAMAESLFSIKELYIMEHTASGQSLKIAQIPKRYKRKQIYENMHLMEGMTFTAVLRYPQMTAITEIPNLTCVPYSERNKYEGKNQAVHFFLDDYRFRNAVWCNLEHTTYSLRKFDYYFTPDLSLWKDLPTDFYNRQNIYRTRFVGAYWQKCGYNVIPTASWGGLNSFAYCFEGLPSNSIIAVSGMGNMASEDAYNRWCYGLRRLEDAKHPISILVYGQELDIPDLHTPVKFIPDFITTKLRKL